MGPPMHHKPLPGYRATLTLSLAMALALVTAGHARPTTEPVVVPRPDKGVLLVAKPEIDGGYFYHSVVLLVRHGQEGTVGLIVNRASEIPVSQVLTELEDSSELYFGGPVALNGILFLFRASNPPKDAIPVMEDLYFSGDREDLAHALEKKGQHRVYFGHAGWAPSQLQNEIERGSWKLVKGDTETVFATQPENLWHQLIGREMRVAGQAQNVLVSAQ